ncbi:hypothetical protein JOD64_002865 [Micromonospora luteifusca]|uniref:Uncharacterized protein n=1 Tax=Micromonospora luteifusca TaxID=709860 RepID=A0ABS2LU01_9ACTN|nr:hypothetical protein [Micromonospora luteifusca]
MQCPCGPLSGPLPHCMPLGVALGGLGCPRSSQCSCGGGSCRACSYPRSPSPRSSPRSVPRLAPPPRARAFGSCPAASLVPVPVPRALSPPARAPFRLALRSGSRPERCVLWQCGVHRAPPCAVHRAPVSRCAPWGRAAPSQSSDRDRLHVRDIAVSQRPGRSNIGDMESVLCPPRPDRAPCRAAPWRAAPWRAAPRRAAPRSCASCGLAWWCLFDQLWDSGLADRTMAAIPLPSCEHAAPANISGTPPREPMRVEPSSERVGNRAGVGAGPRRRSPSHLEGHSLRKNEVRAAPFRQRRPGGSPSSDSAVRGQRPWSQKVIHTRCPQAPPVSRETARGSGCKPVDDGVCSGSRQPVDIASWC